METTINLIDGSQKQAEVIKSIYYTIAGKRVKFHIHETLHLMGCYTISHAKSGIRVTDYPKYGRAYYGLNSANTAKEVLEELIGRVGEEKVKEALIKAGEIF